jgi:hypothetical protein
MLLRAVEGEINPQNVDFIGKSQVPFPIAF